MRKFVATLLIILLCFPIAACGNDGHTEMEPMQFEYVETTDLTEVNNYLNLYNLRKENAHNMAEAARGLGYSESHKIIQLAQAEYGNADELYNKYKEVYNEIWSAKEANFPVASHVWQTMKSYGWNDAVCAGIMANMMAECGGNTLYLQPTIVSYNGLFYGLCQWQQGYWQVWYEDTDGQLAFLRDTIEFEMDTYGSNYSWFGFGYDEFLAIENPEDAAEAFLKCYERGSTSTLSQRKENANLAYEYFT